MEYVNNPIKAVLVTGISLIDRAAAPRPLLDSLMELKRRG
jgi:hypothetical protein